MSEWKEVVLADLVTKITKGTTPPKGQGFVDKNGINYIKSDAIEYDGTVDQNKFVLIDEETHEKFKRSQLEEGDILFSMAGNYLGKSGIVTERMLPANTNQAIAIIRLDKKLVLPQFIGFCFRQPSMITYVNSMSAQSAQPNINFQEIASLNIRLPEIQEQKEIIDVLGNLDKKITLLRQQNQTLEELTQTLFKRWFVEFEFPCLPSGYCPQGQVNLAEMAIVCTYSRVGGLPAPDGQSWFVYVLLCEDGSFYKGMTNDLYRRFYEHCTGDGAKHTKTHKPVKVIHWEQFNTQDEARKREEELKSGYGRTWLQREYEKFLKYGPVANNGLPAQHEGNGLPAHQTRLMMAGKMVESELGEIPEGWRVGELKELADKISKGTTPCKNEVDGLELDVPFIKVKDITDDGQIKSGAIESIPNSVHYGSLKRSILNHNDILFSIAGTIGRVTIVPKDLNNSNCNQAVAFIRLKDIQYLELIHQWFKSQSVQNEVNASVVQGVQANVSLGVLGHLLINIPNAGLIEKWNAVIKPIYEKCNNCSNEIQTLTQLRDTLLPKLMSGEVRVKV
jgi:type I restriction enzyme S subunit